MPHNVHVHSTPVAMQEVLKSQPKLAAVVDGSEAAAMCPVVSIVKGITFVLVRLPNIETHLAAVRASPVGIANVQTDAGWETQLLAAFFYVVTSHTASSSGDSAVSTTTHLRTRMVEPDLGEDPATGAASLALTAYLALQHGGASAKHDFELQQGVEMGRHSYIRVTVGLDKAGTAVERILLAGSAVTTMHGTLEV